MTRLELILKTDQLVGLDILFKAGIIPGEEIRDKDIALQYDAYVKSGISKTRAKEKLSEIFEITERRIESILAKMRA